MRYFYVDLFCIHEQNRLTNSFHIIYILIPVIVDTITFTSAALLGRSFCFPHLPFPCPSCPHQAKFVVGEVSAGGFLCKGLEENPGDSWLAQTGLRCDLRVVDEDFRIF